jgi:Flp pilus assembly protein TadB
MTALAGDSRCDTPGMGWRVRLELLPHRVLFVIRYVFLFAWLLIDSAHDGRSIIGAAVSALFLAAVVTVAAALSRRRDRRIARAEERDDWVTVVRALWTGQAPANTAFDPGLRALAAKRRTDLRRLPWLVTALTLLLLAVTHLSPDPGVIALTCVAGLLTVLSWTDRVRGSHRLARLMAELRTRQVPASP